MLYDYRCNSCKLVKEFRDKVFSGDIPKPCGCGGEFHKIPHRQMTVLFKGPGFTRISTDSYQRKLSPWFGGPQENAPDNEAVREYGESMKRANEIERTLGPHTAGDIKSDATSKLEKASSEASSDLLRF